MSAQSDGAQVPTLTPVRSGNVFEETMGALLQAIRLGEFPAGSKLLPERDLAEALRVSRTTLREVLAQLARSRYITIRRGRYGGAYVCESLPPLDRGSISELDQREVFDLLTVRRVVEPGAAALAAEQVLSDVQRAQLLAAHEDCLAAEPARYRPLDSRLHLLIAELSGSPRLRAVVAETRSGVNALLDCIPLLPANIEHSAEQHQALVNAILAGDPEGARVQMEDHIDGTAALLRGFLA
ncbi:MAG: FCD domain-containing protein [Ornithinimicrobium sp.]